MKTVYSYEKNTAHIAGMATTITLVFADEAHREMWLEGTAWLDDLPARRDYEKRKQNTDLSFLITAPMSFAPLPAKLVGEPRAEKVEEPPERSTAAKTIAEILDDVHESTRTISAMLDDRHPGLATWNECLQRKLAELPGQLAALGIGKG